MLLLKSYLRQNQARKLRGFHHRFGKSTRREP
jgi:hypothetical protein